MWVIVYVMFILYVFSDLSYNDLRWSIEDGGESYVGLEKLEQLDLSFNSIEGVQYMALSPLTSLLKLNLNGNAIRLLLDNPFRNMLGVSGEEVQLLLNTTSMVCDCHLSAWLWDWLSTTSLDLSQLHATCQYPPDYLGTSIKRLPQDPPLPCALSPRPVILSSPQDRIVLKDNDVELECEAMVGSRGGEPVIIWHRDNQQIEPYKLDKRMKVEKPDPDGGVISRLTSMLRLSRVTYRDAGKYQCVVRNDHGVGYSKPAVIEVQIKPYFTVLPVSVQAKVRSLVCKHNNKQ